MRTVKYRLKSIQTDTDGRLGRFMLKWIPNEKDNLFDSVLLRITLDRYAYNTLAAYAYPPALVKKSSL